MISELEIRVRSTELDPLGHVNNAKYLEYLEWARFELWQEAGLPVDFHDSAVGTAVVNVNVDFRREARLGDRLLVRSWLTGLGRSSARLRQTIVNAEGALVCDGRITLATFDTASRRSIPIPDDLRARLEPLVREEEPPDPAA
jgi:thioesterase III